MNEEGEVMDQNEDENVYGQWEEEMKDVDARVKTQIEILDDDMDVEIDLKEKVVKMKLRMKERVQRIQKERGMKKEEHMERVFE